MPEDIQQLRILFEMHRLLGKGYSEMPCTPEQAKILTEFAKYVQNNTVSQIQSLLGGALNQDQIFALKILFRQTRRLLKESHGHYRHLNDERLCVYPGLFKRSKYSKSGGPVPVYIAFAWHLKGLNDPDLLEYNVTLAQITLIHRIEDLLCKGPLSPDDAKKLNLSLYEQNQLNNVLLKHIRKNKTKILKRLDFKGVGE